MNWNDLTNKEKAEMTFRDIQRKQRLREEGKNQAKEYMFETMYKNKIRTKKGKGRIPKSY